MAIYFGEAEQTLDFRTYQDHVAPDTSSNLLYKGVVAGESRMFLPPPVPERAPKPAIRMNRKTEHSSGSSMSGMVPISGPSRYRFPR